MLVSLLALLTSCQSTDQSAEKGASGRALLEAVQLGDNRQVALLLAEGAYTEVRDNKGDTPLLYAVKTGNVQCVRMMLKYDVNREARSGSGKGPIELALDSGNQKMILCLIKGGVPPDEIGHDGNPLLFKAVKFRDMATIKLLLKNKADPNVAGKEGRTALHVAVEHGLTECMDVLIKSGAKVDVRDDEGASALWLALHLANAQKRKAILEGLLSRGADPSFLGPKDKQLLMDAVRRGMLAEAVTLINYGADIHVAHSGDVSLLSLAWQKRNDAMIEMLLSRGADGSAILEEAIEQGDAVLLRMLFESGVSLKGWQSTQSDGVVAGCVRRADYDLAGLFLRHGASPEDKGKEKQRPLHMAVAMRDATMTRLLLEYGANPNHYFVRPASKSFLEMTEKESMRWFLKNERRLSPLMMAANNGDVDIISALIDYGAKKYTYSGRHRLYPVNFASRRGDVKAMQVILGQDPENEKYHAILDLSEQRVRLYDNKGKVVFSSRVSTGKRGFRTPKGVFVITDKHRHHNSTIYGSSMPYFQRLSCSAFGFHSGNCPGYPASHGCIRMPYSAARKLFSLTPVGTRVVIQP